MNPFALIPLKDYIYAGIIAFILGGGWLFIHRCHSAEADLKAIAAESKKVAADATDRVRTLTAQHAKEVKVNETLHEADLQLAAARDAADADRVRQFDTYRKAHPGVPSAAGRPGAGTAGSGGAGQDDDRFASLEQVALGLADAGRGLDAALNACIRDRNDLTGK